MTADADILRDYAEGVAELLAATLRQVEARRALTEACNSQGDGAWAAALVQQKRLAVYAADEDRDSAADTFVAMFKRASRREGFDPLAGVA